MKKYFVKRYHESPCCIQLISYSDGEDIDGFRPGRSPALLGNLQAA